MVVSLPMGAPANSVAHVAVSSVSFGDAISNVNFVFNPGMRCAAYRDRCVGRCWLSWLSHELTRVWVALHVWGIIV